MKTYFYVATTIFLLMACSSQKKSSYSYLNNNKVSTDKSSSNIDLNKINSEQDTSWSNIIRLNSEDEVTKTVIDEKEYFDNSLSSLEIDSFIVNGRKRGWGCYDTKNDGCSCWIDSFHQLKSTKTTTIYNVNKRNSTVNENNGRINNKFQIDSSKFTEEKSKKDSSISVNLNSKKESSTTVFSIWHILGLVILAGIVLYIYISFKNKA